MYERTLTIERLDNVADVFGSFDENIKLIEQAYAVRIVNRETELRITGDNPESVAKTEMRNVRYSGSLQEEIIRKKKS